MTDQSETDPELLRLLEKSYSHIMTPEEVQEQRESWARSCASRPHLFMSDFKFIGMLALATDALALELPEKVHDSYAEIIEEVIFRLKEKR